MNRLVKPAAALTLLLCAQWPMTVLGGHPLFTEDTGTQGAGNYQLELTHDLSHTRDGETKARAKSINAVLSAGLTDTLDFIITLPYEELSERTGSSSASAAGFADSEVAAKWRFYEEDALSLALRPGLGLPTGNGSEGLRSDEVTPSLFAVATWANDPWAFNIHVGYTRNLDRGTEDRLHIYHASASVEFSVGEALRLVSDVSVESNTDRSGDPSVGSVVFGLVYSLTPDLDVDFGYRKGLTDAAPDHAWLTGLAFRF